MNDNLTTYKIWAPDDALWTAWAKPVLFAGQPINDNYPFDIPEIKWLPREKREKNENQREVSKNTMIIIDLPDKEGVLEGLALAQLGYRPVPLYNGVYAGGYNYMNMLVNVRDIVIALYKGADILTALDITTDAPPVFLLDYNRMRAGGKVPGMYDNRWCVFPQDMPSSAFLIKNGISKVILRTTHIQTDLSHILCRYQEQGIQIILCDSSGSLKETTVAKPSQFKSLIYRFQVILGLTRNAAGGFGGMIPEQVESGSGAGYYRMG